jgi:hypothetical protein
MAAAVITAAATFVVAIIAFMLNQWSQRHLERRQAQVARISQQLRQLYGPLNALVDSNEYIWEALRLTTLPSAEHRRRGNLSEADRAIWERWLTCAFMPANRKMRDLIVEHADLLIEPEIPESLRLFCAHVAASEVTLVETSEGGARPDILIRHPGASYVTYVRNSFKTLKADQLRLLGLNTQREP